jgi:hypothetical protein
MEKSCCRCKKIKDIEMFSVGKSRIDGRQSACKECHRKYYVEHQEEIKIRAAEWSKNNKYAAAITKKAYYQRHREEWKAKASDRAKTRPDRTRVIQRRCHIKRRFGLTLERFESMLEEQNYSCAVCACKTPGGQGSWHVDHDHSCCDKVKTCGKCVRGILCVRCNSGLGLFKDSTILLDRAMEYLRKHQAVTA